MRHSRRVVTVVAIATLLLSLFVAPAGAVQSEHDVVVSADPANNTPHALDGSVLAIAEVGDRIVVGGTFSQIRSASNSTPINRRYLFAFDRDTGAIDNSFAPTLNNVVETLAAAPDGQSVFVGGRFNTVNGQTRRNVVKLNLSNGAVVGTFTANTNSRVNDLDVRDGTVYLGGQFSQVNGTPRTALAAVDATTGQVDPDVNLVYSDPYGGRDGVGTLSIQKLDVTPDGSRLVTLGNYGTIDGQDRDQVAMIDLTSSPARLADWHTTRYGQTLCSPSFDTYTRDVEISADGSYMVIVSTGAYRANQLCDTAARWDLDATGSNLQPEWVNSTGGDTLYGVAITGEAIYIGGHQRWQNNPFAGDRAGPGAVPREGLAALDPANGMPLSWDPGRDRGVGVFDLIGTDAGLWLGSDTDRIGRWEYHGRLAMFPTQGGVAIPSAEPGPLPGQLFNAQPDGGARDPAYLYRVNTGGNLIGASDAGPDWSADSQSQPSGLRNAGSNAAGWSGALAGTSNVPSTTPVDVFASERWDPSNAPEMQWDFPVEAGRTVEVRLYLASRCSCTDDPGERVFDVAIDDTTVLDDYDIVADVGQNVATVKAFPVTSDGSVDLDFGHVRENPLVNAIEIVDPALVGTFEPTGSPLEYRAFDGTDLGAAQTVGGPIDWSQARGAFMLSGQLYTLWSDGHLYRRAFDGSSFGDATDLDLHGLTTAHFPIASVTGAFYEPVKKRLYYTVAGQSTLYYRYFSPESGIVGAETFTATGNLAGLDWSTVRGMHLANTGALYYGATDGNLRRIDFVDNQPVAGTIATVAGPATGDGTNWDTRALFLYSGEDFVGSNTAPTADVAASCDELTCTFDATGSDDPDGTIASFAWNFGDGETATGTSVEHTYTSSGTFDVRLTVTDDDGASATATATVTVAAAAVAPSADFSASCADLGCSFDASASSDDGAIDSYAWDFGDGTTDTGETVAHTYAAAGSYTVELTVTDDAGLTDTTSQQVTVTQAGADIAFKDATSHAGNRNRFTVSVPDSVVAGDALLLFATYNVNSVNPAPTGGTGWTQVDTQVAGNIRTTLWSKVADAADAGAAVTLNTGTYTKGDVVLAAYSGTSATASIDGYAVAGETSYRAEHTTPTVTAAANGGMAVSYWSERSGATNQWTTVPAGQAVRREAFGTGGGHVSVLLADQAPVSAGSHGGLTAVANNANDDATMWTVVLRAQ